MAARRLDAQSTTPAELDEVTLRRAQRGDDDACRALVIRYQRPVFALLHRMLGVEAMVEDVAQESFLAVFRALDGFAPLGPARLSTWILTIASRRAIDALRGRSPVGESIDVHADVLAGAARADDGVRQSRLGAAIERAVRGLPPDQRATFILREYHGFEYAAIARALEIDVGTVKSRLARARVALRAALHELSSEVNDV